LDVTPVTTGQTGVARYGRELARELPGCGVELRPFAVGRGVFAAPPQTRRSRLPLRWVQRSWRAVGRPRAEDLAGPVDLVHSIDLVPPPTRAPLVMTAHDVMAIERPDLHPELQVVTQRRQLLAWRAADHVLAVSQATADALVRHGVSAERISVTRHGLTALAPAGARQVDGPYVLAVGEVNARKDLATLIEAFRAADLPASVSLVLAGPPGYRAAETLALVGDRVRHLGRVSDEALGALYRDALCLCFPSLGEGYGLPVLEAMSAGLPVLASDLPVFREVGGDAAVYAPAGSVSDWAQALSRLVADDDRRRQLSAAGRERAAAATWRATAEATVRAYERALG
jgi:glycosyltransferase involved in cell wall biosynthesis